MNGINPNSFSLIPEDVTSLIVNMLDYYQFPHLATVCKPWNGIILENKQYQKFKLAKSFTIALNDTDYPKKIPNRWYIERMRLEILETGEEVENLVNLCGKELLNMCGTVFLYEGTTSLVYFSCNHLLNEKVKRAKWLLDAGALVNMATSKETSKENATWISLKKHTTPLFAAAVVAKNLDLVLLFKSHGGVCHPILDPVENKDAIALLDKADDILFGTPVQLIKGFKSEDSAFSQLPVTLIRHIGKLFIKSYT